MGVNTKERQGQNPFRSFDFPGFLLIRLCLDGRIFEYGRATADPLGDDGLNYSICFSLAVDVCCGEFDIFIRSAAYFVSEIIYCIADHIGADRRARPDGSRL